MKDIRIKYSKYFHPIQSGEWIGLEGSLEEGETVLDAFSKARAIAQAAFEQGKDEVLDIQLAIVNEETKKPPVGDVVSDIMSCDDFTILESYKLLVEKKKVEKPEWKAAYDKRRAELIAKESQELVDKADKLIPSKKRP